MAVVKSDHKKKPERFSFLQNKKIVYLVNVDWFFMSHRLPLARAARDAGAEVIVAAGDTGKGKQLEGEGIKFVPLPFSRQGTRPLHEVSTIGAIFSFLRKTKPDILHTVSIKPVLYGSLLSRIMGQWWVVNAVSGLGFVFSKDRKATLLRKGLSLFYKIALRNPKRITIFQNSSDLETMVSGRFLEKEQAVLIKGSGVDCDLYKPAPFPEKPVVMLASRMLWDKGIGEFVEASKLLNPRFPKVRFVLVGASDDENPKAIKKEQLIHWMETYPFIEWWGARTPEEMPKILSQATIVTLPSYYEGLPKVLLEAAACGRPVVASEIPGCKEIVREGINGYLVKAGSARSLASKISILLKDKQLIYTLGKEGRRIACNEFGEKQIVSEIFKLYERLLMCKPVDDKF
jgi:glycosyltransferase involved in cell wall biosynthesis